MSLYRRQLADVLAGKAVLRESSAVPGSDRWLYALGYSAGVAAREGKCEIARQDASTALRVAQNELRVAKRQSARAGHSAFLRDAKHDARAHVRIAKGIAADVRKLCPSGRR